MEIIIAVSVLFVFLLIVFIVVYFSKPKKEKDKTDKKKSIYDFDKKPLKARDELSIGIAGQNAENEVSNALKVIAKKYNCYLYENLCLEDEGNISVEIDHLLLTKGGLCVIETKGNIGVIYGDKDEKVWASVKPSGKTKKLKNPIIQTCAHAAFLRRLLNDFYPKMVPMAIFPNADISNIDSKAVYTLETAIKKIETLCTSTKYNDELLSNFNDKICNAIERHSITKEKHLQNIEERYK